MKLQPIIKWPGGKEKELNIIRQYAPIKYRFLYDPFVGGGSVSMCLDGEKILINDLSYELISLYKNIATSNSQFYKWTSALCKLWDGTLVYINTHQILVTDYYNLQAKKISIEDLLQHIDAEVVKNKLDLLSLLPKGLNNYSTEFLHEIRIRLRDKVKRMRMLELRQSQLSRPDVYGNIETGMMNAIYMFLRKLYNDKKLATDDPSLASALFFFIRNFAYSGMFRYNKNGDFNVPYGGMGYNHKHISEKLVYYRSKVVLNHVAKFEIFSEDFLVFLRENPPSKDDFIFLDPPYDSEFSTYAKNQFTKDDQIRLANYLCTECQGQWMVIIKYTDFIYGLYNKPNVNIRSFDKKYQVSFMNRNNRNVTHLLITNY